MGTALLALLLLSVAFARPALAVESGGFEFVEALGPDGTSASGFSYASSVAVDQKEDVVYVLDSGTDALFKFDLEGNPVDFGGSSPDVSGNELSGLTIKDGQAVQVAVNSTTHIIYLTAGEAFGGSTSIQAFHANGDPAMFTKGPNPGTNEIGGFEAVQGVAVDSSGNVYISGTPTENGFNNNDVSIYSSSGALLVEHILITGNFASGNIAVNSEGVVHIPTPYGPTRYIPSEYPITSDTTYTEDQETFGSAVAMSLAIDPATDEVFVVEGAYAGEPERIAVYDQEGTLLNTFGGPGEAGELDRPAGVAIDSAAERAFVVHNPEGGPAQLEIFQRQWCVCAPSIEATFASEVSGDSAKLWARVNSNSLETTYWFEYGPQDCELGGCEKAPLDGASIPPAHQAIRVSQSVAGLQPQTLYHYRVVAENEEGTVEGPDRTLTTQGSGLGFQLSDSRVWEMVSPPDKHGALLVGIGQGQIQAAEDGNALAYLSINTIEEGSEGSRVWEAASVLARRGTEGWRSEDISTAHDRVVPLTVGNRGEYKLFSSDLSRSLVHPRGATLLSPQASDRTPYLRENTEPGVYTPLVTGKEGFANVPPGTEFGGNPGATFGPLALAGATSDLDHVVLSSCSQFGCTSLGPGPGLYRWSAGQLHPVSELPAGEGGDVVSAVLGSGLGSVRHAISEDGSRIFWTPTAGGDYSGVTGPALYLRDTVAEESIRLDVVQPGASGAGENRPAFNHASADGSVVYFTDSRQLTADASPSGRDLYRCEIGMVEGSLGCATLTDISAPLAGSGESADVQGQVPAMSDDGSRLYFVARGVLDQAPNERGDVAIAGEPNLYLFEEEGGVRFIATLSMDDRPSWGSLGAVHGDAPSISADASPSGRYFTFMSERSLTGHYNVDAASGEPTEEVFRYDAASERLDCVSCNPSGGAPLGQQIEAVFDLERALVDTNVLWNRRWLAAAVPEATMAGIASPSFYRSRAVLDNGRTFFNAIDALVAADSNGEWDVYQWEPTGVGDCTASSGGASVSRSAGGCVSLLSSGTGEDEAVFLDASASGDDVFFLTPARLSVLDKDTELDAYDARVDGVAATLPPDTECLGEACQPAAIAPNDPTPASAGFRGQGDPKQSARKRCAKGKRLVRRKGRARCVARKHKRQGRAATKRRASR